MLKGKGMNNLVHPEWQRRAQRLNLVKDNGQREQRGPRPRSSGPRRIFFSGSYHEVVELRRPGHELRLALGHADFHKSGMLAGLGLPHLTHDPEGKIPTRSRV